MWTTQFDGPAYFSDGLVPPQPPTTNQETETTSGIVHPISEALETSRLQYLAPPGEERLPMDLWRWTRCDLVAKVTPKWFWEPWYPGLQSAFRYENQTWYSNISISYRHTHIYIYMYMYFMYDMKLRIYIYICMYIYWMYICILCTICAYMYNTLWFYCFFSDPKHGCLAGWHLKLFPMSGRNGDCQIVIPGSSIHM